MNKILIRPLEQRDAFTSYKWRNDSEVWKFTGSRPDKEITEEIELTWINKVINEKSSKRFAILVNDEYVGNIQLTNITSIDAEYHIFIGNKDYWGKGVAKEATYQILSYAKNFLGLAKVFLFVSKNNKAAIVAYEKNAFLVSEEDEKSLKMVCDLGNLPPPKVSVFCMVYNHEKFVAQAIEGFLMQEVSFSTLMVIGEDNSTDASRQVIQKYSNLYPGKFKLILHNKNVGPKQNQIEVLNECTGNYIAMCEGDDYWTDPLKLQKQVDFLQANPQDVMCFHKVNILKTNGELVEDFLTKVPEKYQERETLLAKGNYIHTPSVLFRNNLITIPDIFHQSPIGDFLLYVLLTKHGNIGYLQESMAVYRHNVGVLSKSVGNAFKNQLIMNLILLKIVDDEKYNTIVINRIIEFVFLHFSNLPLNILKDNLKNIPVRFFKKYIR